MLKRKIVNELETWASGAHKKALLLKGARQVGKTTSVREFAKQHYSHFVEINFEKYPTARQAFDGNLDANTIPIIHHGFWTICGKQDTRFL